MAAPAGEQTYRSTKSNTSPLNISQVRKSTVRSFLTQPPNSYYTIRVKPHRINVQQQDSKPFFTTVCTERNLHCRSRRNYFFFLASSFNRLDLTRGSEAKASSHERKARQGGGSTAASERARERERGRWGGGTHLDAGALGREAQRRREDAEEADHRTHNHHLPLHRRRTTKLPPPDLSSQRWMQKISRPGTDEIPFPTDFFFLSPPAAPLFSWHCVRATEKRGAHLSVRFTRVGECWCRLPLAAGRGGPQWTGES
jgi:hypothetical protein